MGFNIHILSVRNRSTNLPSHAALAASFNPPSESRLLSFGSLHKAAASSFLFVVMVAISVERSMVLFGVRGMAIGAIIRGLSLISVRPAQCIKRRV